MIQLMIRTFNYGFEFQSPKYADTCQVQIAMYRGGLRAFDYFLQNYTIKSMKCQHNPYLESIKTSIIGRKLGNSKKHNR